ncbi:glyoxylase-like metal-dependent hydrolase (beta-lactamase superfamily II) [Microvirga flocculans]|uniref:Glyoxylase-like metal-dependent hydrolase (Beta-lactamase superfamily II) n=1 Tax=Microvirga flocculans TaxID=217168 RepID=A0A7W6IBW4_9HYPH|nr:glyoxylase-like metal-dependent hydrolase (beta-lactamase superfamily II) [Microvirga flocculans]
MPDVRAAIIPVTPFQQNCTLLWCEKTKKAAVVDPGGDLDRIRQAIAQSGVSVEKILLTHGHIDHAGGAADLRDELGVPVEGPHEADRFLLDHLEETGRGYGIPARPVTPDRWLNEGDTVTLGDLTLDVLHCPGHSPGSVVLVSKAERFALVGDVLFQGSVGRTDLPGGDGKALIRSIKDKLLPLGDDIAFICGHGPMSTLGQERQTNPFLQGEELL